MNSYDTLALDYFVAGVPPGPLFKMSIDNLKEIVEFTKEKEHGLNLITEICLIGLVSYFEAFCKNEFASLVNICPQILNNFCKRRPDVTINVKDFLAFDFNTKNKIGFLLSEKYDFGTANKINSLYNDLVSITPFSKDEMKKYDQLLNDRNLLTHHSGIYTIKYHKQKFIKKSIKNKVFYNSLVVKKNDFMASAKFLEKVAIKIINNSYKATTEFIKHEKLKLSEGNKQAHKFLQWYE